MSDTVQAVAESLIDEFGRYVKPPKDGTIVWKIGKAVSYSRPLNRIADSFMVVWSKREANQVFLASYGTNDPQIYSVFLDDPGVNGAIFYEFVDVCRELARGARLQLEYLQRECKKRVGAVDL